MDLYKISYNIKLRGEWHGSGSEFDARVVLTNGDAKTAITKLEKAIKKEDYEGAHPTAVKIIEVECVATDVLV